MLTWTAAQLMFHEPRLESFIKGHSLIQAIIYAGIIGGVLLAGLIAERRRKQTAWHTLNRPSAGGL